MSRKLARAITVSAVMLIAALPVSAKPIALPEDLTSGLGSVDNQMLRDWGRMSATLMEAMFHCSHHASGMSALFADENVELLGDSMMPANADNLQRLLQRIKQWASSNEGVTAGDCLSQQFNDK